MSIIFYDSDFVFIKLPLIRKKDNLKDTSLLKIKLIINLIYFMIFINMEGLRHNGNNAAYRKPSW